MVHEKDLQTVKNMLAGDEAAFNAFYEAFYDRVFRFCARRLDDEDTAYDIVQQTFERALKYLYTYKGEASLYTWLCQICRNEIARWFGRKSNKSNLHVSIDDNPAIRAILESDEYGGMVDEQTQLELAQIVHIAIDGMPKHYVEVLRLKYLKGVSVEEIGIQIGLSFLATESLLARARRTFRGLVGDMTTEYSMSGKQRGLER